VKGTIVQFSFASIVIPQTIDILGGWAFSECERMLLAIEEGNEHLALDGDSLRSFDRSIRIVCFEREDIVCMPRTVGSSVLLVSNLGNPFPPF
jgi:hypothetical protein